MGVPNLSATAGDAGESIPVAATWTGTLVRGRVPHLPPGAGHARIAIPVATILADTASRGGIPPPAIGAATHTLVAIPQLPRLTGDAGGGIKVGVGRAGGDAVAVEGDGVAGTLSAGASNEEEVTVAEVVVEGRGGKG